MDGSISSDPRELAVMANDFYSNLYASEGTIGMEEVFFTHTAQGRRGLELSFERLYTKEEVKEALFQMFPTKAPGPNGLPTHLFHKGIYVAMKLRA